MSGTKEAGFDNISTFRPIQHIKKRDGNVAEFDMDKIVDAIYAAMTSNDVLEGSIDDAIFVARKVQSSFQKAAMLVTKEEIVPSVEAIQDAVERELMSEGFTKTAKHYILYREARAKDRKADQLIPPHVKQLTLDSKKYFPNSLSEFIYYRTYSRWIEAEGRRETYIETVGRYINYMREVLGDRLTEAEYNECQQYILHMWSMPSMRLMWSAGDACRRTNVAAFNCSFDAPTTFQDFGDMLYILACGTGFGFSAESRNVGELPTVKYQTGGGKEHHVIDDSKEGWANALVRGIKTWYEGRDITFDTSEIREEGARLKTMGGRSSGPKPLEDLLAFTRSIIFKRQGRRLRNIDVHDIKCKIGECIVAGGVRRSALISLSDRDDTDMRLAKSGHFFIANGQRVLANNSAVYDVKPTAAEFIEDWHALVDSHSGERGIFNRGGLLLQIPKRREEKWVEMGAVNRDLYAPINVPMEEIGKLLLAQVGTNPCGEITLLPKQFCNLTEVVCRLGDTEESLIAKVRIATILGTYQSMLTNFPYIHPKWKENCDAERLLGVSFTGQWDCPKVREEEVLAKAKSIAIKVNAEYAQRFGIPASTSITCGKPSGTLSQLVDAANGGHARYAPYYIRRVRISATDPLFHMLKDQGLPYFPENNQTHETASTFVLEFPVSSPTGPYSKDLTAIQQLEHWKKVKINFTEHNPSVTISVADNEWIAVQYWVYENWDIVGGLSFLPREDHVYKLAPYEEITKERYEEMLKAFEDVDYSRILTYEKEDNTTGAKELACVGNTCEI